MTQNYTPQVTVTAPKPKFSWKDRPKGKNNHTWQTLKSMPPLSHWPNRPAEFKHENSLVVQHIMKITPCEFLRAKSLFEMAKKAQVILFDPQTKLWSGNKDWQA